MYKKMTGCTFFEKHDYDYRLKESERIVSKYNGAKIPVIVEPAHGSGSPGIDKNKYICPGDITLGQFIHLIREKINMRPEQSIIVFANASLPCISTVMSDVYEEHKTACGFLRLTYTIESTFG